MIVPHNLDENEELRVAAILEEELQVFSIQTELRELPANPVCYRLARGCPHPTVTPAGMLELQIAAVFKVKQRLGEAGIYRVSSRLCFGEIGQHMETCQSRSWRGAVSICKSNWKGNLYVYRPICHPSRFMAFRIYCDACCERRYSHFAAIGHHRAHCPLCPAARGSATGCVKHLWLIRSYRAFSWQLQGSAGRRPGMIRSVDRGPTRRIAAA